MTTQTMDRPTDYIVAEAPEELARYKPAPEPIERGVVYLLHFDRPISDKHTCQHYIGWTSYLPARAMAHLQGRGARLTQVAYERGISFVIARVWPGTRDFERKLLCPICAGRYDTSALDALDALDTWE